MSEEIDRWIKYMKEHPDTWKKKHTAFVDAQFEKSRAFIKRILKTPNGKQKIIDIYNIKNEKGYSKLFGEQISTILNAKLK